MKLIKEGFFVKSEVQKQRYDNICNFIGFDYSDKQKSRIISYLSNGKLLAIAPGVAHDLMDESRKICGMSVQTDGVFVWPGELSYYVDQYNVKISDMMLLHMEVVGWQVVDVDVSLLVDAEY